MRLWWPRRAASPIASTPDVQTSSERTGGPHPGAPGGDGSGQGLRDAHAPAGGADASGVGPASARAPVDTADSGRREWAALPSLRPTVSSAPFIAPSQRFYLGTAGFRPLLAPAPPVEPNPMLDTPRGTVVGLAEVSARSPIGWPSLPTAPLPTGGDTAAHRPLEGDADRSVAEASASPLAMAPIADVVRARAVPAVLPQLAPQPAPAPAPLLRADLVLPPALHVLPVVDGAADAPPSSATLVLPPAPSTDAVSSPSGPPGAAGDSVSAAANSSPPIAAGHGRLDRFLEEQGFDPNSDELPPQPPARLSPLAAARRNRVAPPIPLEPITRPVGEDDGSRAAELTLPPAPRVPPQEPPPGPPFTGSSAPSPGPLAPIDAAPTAAPLLPLEALEVPTLEPVTRSDGGDDPVGRGSLLPALELAPPAVSVDVPSTPAPGPDRADVLAMPSQPTAGTQPRRPLRTRIGEPLPVIEARTISSTHSVDRPALAPAPRSQVDRVPADIRETFLARHGLDPDTVPIHRGPEAESLAREAGARAYAHDGEIVLPQSAGPLTEPRARGLLAHELTHVVQQRTYGSSGPLEHSPLGRRLEEEATRAEREFGGSPIAPSLAPIDAEAIAEHERELGELEELVLGLRRIAEDMTRSGFATAVGGRIVFDSTSLHRDAPDFEVLAAAPPRLPAPPRSPVQRALDPAVADLATQASGQTPLSQMIEEGRWADLDASFLRVQQELDAWVEQQSAQQQAPTANGAASQQVADAAPGTPQATAQEGPPGGTSSALVLPLMVTSDSAAAATAAAGQDDDTGQIPIDRLDLDELASRLYRRIRSQLRTDLLVERERSGLLTDLH